MVTAYEKIVGITVRPASPEKLFIDWVSGIILQERQYLNYVGNQNLPSRSEGENLDALGELFYQAQRPAARPSTCTVKFYISEAQKSAILIPAGTRVTDTNAALYWQTGADEYIPAGATDIEIGVTCLTSGSQGNGYTAGQINTLVDIFDYYDHCENTTVSANGSDEATDDDFFDLMKASQDALSTAGPMGGYIYHAKSASGQIEDVVANSPTPGVVNLYAIMTDGTIATEETKNAMLAACNAEERRPLTDMVVAADPEEVEYDIAFTWYLTRDSTKSAAEIGRLVNEAVEQYKAWQSGKLGRDINPDHLRSLLLDTGIKRAVLTAPEFKALEDGKPKNTTRIADQAPQIAKVRSVTIISGGYEDE